VAIYDRTQCLVSAYDTSYIPYCPNWKRRKTVFLVLVRLSIRWREVVSLVLRLGVLGGTSGRRTMVGGEDQDMLLCLVVDETVF
jgi:hypothetical protein